MRSLLAAALLCTTSSLAAQVASPDRPVTDPKSLISPVNPDARPVPLDDIGITRTTYGVSWTPDGKHIVIGTNLTGRYNIWRTDAGGSWPLQLTQNDEVQYVQGVSRDGKWAFFRQDVGGNEYHDIYRVPLAGGAPENLTNTPDRNETGLLVAPQGDAIALTTKLKSEGQGNLAVMNSEGNLRVLTKEADPNSAGTPSRSSMKDGLLSPVGPMSMTLWPKSGGSP